MYFCLFFSAEKLLTSQGNSQVADKINEKYHDIVNDDCPDADAGTYSDDDEAGVYAGAGVGRVEGRRGNDKAVLRGPNAGVGAYKTSKEVGAGAKAEVYKSSVTLGPVKLKEKILYTGVKGSISETGVKAMANAEVASVSLAAGPVEGKVGLGFDTGLQAGTDGVGVKFLGTGFSIGKTSSISFMGSELKLKWPF